VGGLPGSGTFSPRSMRAPLFGGFDLFRGRHNQRLAVSNQPFGGLEPHLVFLDDRLGADVTHAPGDLVLFCLLEVQRVDLIHCRHRHASMHGAEDLGCRLAVEAV
jgi:hypothetical protein